MLGGGTQGRYVDRMNRLQRSSAEHRDPAPHGPGATPSPASLRVQLLGGFRVVVGERVVEETRWRVTKARSLVKLLALAPGHQLGREQVLDLLWPELDAVAAGNNFHRTLHAARRALAGDPAARHTTLLTLRAGVLTLAPGGSLWVDVAAFEEAAAAARRADDPAVYHQALALYTGDLLPEDRYEDWAASRRETLRETYLGLLLAVARLHDARGEGPLAQAALERAVAVEPAHEDAHVGLMRLHALAGRRGQALRHYVSLRDALRRELGAEPDAASQRLYAAILAGRFPPPEPRAEADPPAPERPRSHNLPVALTGLVGRAREVAAVTALLPTTRLLTLVGAGGCGKTRLMLAVARQVVDRYPDGVWLVELAALADPALVPGAVAQALAVREQPGRAIRDTLADALRSKTLLLVLDNCEHLIAACAELVDTLLAAAPGLRVLATSREALRVPGEVAWRVPSLALPTARQSASPDELARVEAVQLLLDRIRWRQPAFALTPGNAAAIAEVCRRLDGIPLAIELAAARAAILAPEQLVARLDDALPLLTGGSRTAPSRQQTLRATLDWSYRLLEEPERRLVGRLAVFAGGWTMEAAEGVCAGQGIAAAEVLALLAALVDKSLVQVEEARGQVRYRLLETVRQYAGERLAACGEADAMRRRHAAYYLAWAEQVEPLLSGPAQGAWLDRLAEEYDNLRAALRWAADHGDADTGLRLGGALWRFWSVRGPYGEGRAWLTLLLARAGSSGDTAVRAKALASAGLLAHQQGDYAAARPFFEACLALRREIGDPGAIARALTNLSFVAPEQAGALLEEALALGRAAGDKLGILRTLNTLGEIAWVEGDYERATPLYEESLALCRESGDRLGAIHVSYNLGSVALARGDAAGAAPYFRASLRLCRELGDQGLAGKCLLALASVAAATEQPARAARLYGAARVLYEATGLDEDRIGRAHARQCLTTARAALGEAAFAAAQAQGRALSLEEALAEALHDAED